MELGVRPGEGLASWPRWGKLLRLHGGSESQPIPQDPLAPKSPHPTSSPKRGGGPRVGCFPCKEGPGTEGGGGERPALAREACWWPRLAPSPHLGARQRGSRGKQAGGHEPPPTHDPFGRSGAPAELRVGLHHSSHPETQAGWGLLQLGAIGAKGGQGSRGTNLWARKSLAQLLRSRW